MEPNAVMTMTLAGGVMDARLLQDFQAVGAGLVEVKVGDDDFGRLGVQCREGVA